MRKKYQAVIFTNIPAFYKVNLFNEIEAKGVKLLVVFLRQSESLREKDFTVIDSLNSDHQFIHGKNLLSISFELLKILFHNEAKDIVVGGWDEIVYWLIRLLPLSKRRSLILESSFMDSESGGLKGHIKSFFLKKVDLVFASGRHHVNLLNALRYEGDIKITNGVGLINTPNISLSSTKEFMGRFIYVGRFVKEKNLELLIEYFNSRKDYSLTLIGTGPLRENLNSQIKSGNIHIIDYVENSKLGEYYLNNDVFILPSKKEPWGIVVDEAIYFGLPVLVNINVGCKDYFVDQLDLGLSFDGTIDSLSVSIDLISENYNQYYSNVKDVSIKDLNKQQTKVFVDELNT